MTFPTQEGEVTLVASNVNRPRIHKDGKLNSNHQVTISDR